MKLTEQAFDQLTEYHDVVASSWNSSNSSTVTVIGNDHGTPVAIRYSSEQTNFDFMCFSIEKNSEEKRITPPTHALSRTSDLVKQLRLLLVTYRENEDESYQIANERPEDRVYFEAQATGFMRCRIELEVLLAKMGHTYPSNIVGALDAPFKEGIECKSIE